MHLIKPLLVFIVFLTAAQVRADVYRYRDSEGRDHFVTSPNAVPEQYRTPYALPRLGKYKGGDFATPLPKAATVVVFVTEWCAYCRRLEAFLDERGIAYRSYDIEKSGEGKRLYSALGVTGVPATKIGGRVIAGFDPDAILSALKK